MLKRDLTAIKTYRYTKFNHELCMTDESRAMFRQAFFRLWELGIDHKLIEQEPINLVNNAFGEPVGFRDLTVRVAL